MEEEDLNPDPLRGLRVQPGQPLRALKLAQLPALIHKEATQELNLNNPRQTQEVCFYIFNCDNFILTYI